MLDARHIWQIRQRGGWLEHGDEIGETCAVAEQDRRIWRLLRDIHTRHRAKELRPDDSCHGWEPGLRALLRNLLDNAIRYSFAGGRVTINIAAHDNGTRLSITDHGPGIEPARRAAMFERFQRGPEGISEGSGLGLSIVARIAELHHARIMLADADGPAGLRVDVDFSQAANRPEATTSTVVDRLSS